MCRIVKATSATMKNPGWRRRIEELKKLDRYGLWKPIPTVAEIRQRQTARQRAEHKARRKQADQEKTQTTEERNARLREAIAKVKEDSINESNGLKMTVFERESAYRAWQQRQKRQCSRSG